MTIAEGGASVTPAVVTRWLGRVEYQSTWTQMRAFTDQRQPDTPDELWFLEHTPVFTLGQAGKPEHILAAGDIPVVNTDRGGQVTYHGPGQLVVYPLLDLARLKLGPKELVRALESALLDSLADDGITAQRHEGAPGIYVADAKIASIGLRVRRNACYHGISLNVDMDLSPFLRINPCGYRGQKMTQLKDWRSPCPTVQEASQRLLPHLLKRLGLTTRASQV